MNTTKETERAAIKSVYPNSDSWSRKVDKMSSQQVTAIYLRFKSQGKLS